MSKPTHSPTLTVFGVTMLRPDFVVAITAALVATGIFMIYSAVLPPESGPQAAGRWGSFFMAVLSARCQVFPFRSVGCFTLWFAGIIVGSLACTIVFVIALELGGM